MHCPRCDLDHPDEPDCLRAVAGLARLLLWEVRELRAAVDLLREERRREAVMRTSRPGRGPA